MMMYRTWDEKVFISSSRRLHPFGRLHLDWAGVLIASWCVLQYCCADRQSLLSRACVLEGR